MFQKQYLYSHSWTEFEVQALAYGILRKALYPEFIVRGEFFFPRGKKSILDPTRHKVQSGYKIDIVIFRPGIDKIPPLPILLIEVKKGIKSISITQGERYQKELGIPCIYIRGKEDAFNVLQLVQEYLQK